MMEITQPIRILFVEDNPDDAVSFRRCLTSSDYNSEITHCVRAEDALALVNGGNTEFDILVSDHKLLGMTGLELCIELYNIGVPFPLLMLTGTGNEGVAVEALKKGVDDYIIKDPGDKYFKLVPDTIVDVIGRYRERQSHQVALDKLHESEEKYRNLVEKANMGIYILQANKFVYVNETFEKITGYKFEEVSLEGFDVIDLVAPESREFISQRNASREAGEIIDNSYIFKGLSKTGYIIDLEANTSVLEYEGKPAIQGIIKDITEQMQDKREKMELQEKLKRSERMESLGLLAGGVAHDLNNVIGPIMAYPDLIKMDIAEGKSVDKDLDTIKFSARRAADVIADLLALTRRGQYKMEPIDLNDIVNDYLSSAEYDASKRLHSQVETDIRLSEEPLFFNGSQAHLPKIVMNLVINAFESMSEGGILTITTSSTSEKGEDLSDKQISEGRYILLTIKDQGEGISEKNISQIYDPFFTTKMKSGKSGTGLGLSVVYNVLEDHGAQINVVSKLGIGTKFCIYFPETMDKEKRTEKKNELVIGSGNILVVDDRKEHRDLATRILNKLGYDVKSVDSGQETVKYLKNNKVDLIWLDMILEDDMDGLDTFKEIIKINPNQKTIIVSGYSESERVKEAGELGVKGFIQKPYKIDEIGMTIQNVLSGNNGSWRSFLD